MEKIYRAEIDCANCAAKEERAMNKIKGVEASLNFMTKKLTFKAPEESYDALLQEAMEKAKKIESDFEIEEYDD
jgi:cation transport ATPase